MPCNGYYKLEVWGAQGAVGRAAGNSGSNIGTLTGGYGGYSVGLLSQNKNSKLYVNVGGQGKTAASAPSGMPSYNDDFSGWQTFINAKMGGYNGGTASSGLWFTYAGSGGATHIATKSGLLSSLSSYKGTLVSNSYYNSQTILIVAGGGGIATPHAATYGDGINCTDPANGGNGGGYQGVGKEAFGGTQTSGGISRYATSSGTVVRNEGGDGKFGQGGLHSVKGCSSSAGGSGFFGGASACNYSCGGGGSGYIASSLLLSGGGITKHMTGYNVPTSTVAATRTNSNATTPTNTPTADVARTGNGYAKITYIAPSI